VHPGDRGPGGPCRQVHVHPVVDQQFGPAGGELTGGQGQFIEFARAFLLGAQLDPLHAGLHGGLDDLKGAVRGAAGGVGDQIYAEISHDCP